IRCFHVTGVQTCALPISLLEGVLTRRSERSPFSLPLPAFGRVCRSPNAPVRAGGKGQPSARRVKALSRRAEGWPFPPERPSEGAPASSRRPCDSHRLSTDLSATLAWWPRLGWRPNDNNKRLATTVRPGE